VLELPHLKDEYALDDAMIALRRYYVITDVSRAATGFSQTWYPHLLRAKCQPLIDSQEFKEILDAPSGDGNKTLRDVISTYNKSIEINQSIISQAELDVPISGYNTTPFFTIPRNEEGFVDYADVSNDNVTADSENPIFDAAVGFNSPKKNVYVGYLTADGLPPNGVPYGLGSTFPTSPIEGEFYLRTDYFPNRLFRWNGRVWNKFEDNVRMTLNNFGVEDTSPGALFAGGPTNKTQKGTFINNNTTATIGGEVVPQRQALSKILKPRADN
jgi:hypothetical protein